eukprot:3000046-Pyramimonas_sp.AAC.1
MHRYRALRYVLMHSWAMAMGNPKTLHWSRSRSNWNVSQNFVISQNRVADASPLEVPTSDRRAWRHTTSQAAANLDPAKKGLMCDISHCWA